MAALASKCPPEFIEWNLTDTLSPPPKFHIWDSFSNTAVLTLGQMADVLTRWDSSRDQFNLHADEGFLAPLISCSSSHKADEEWRNQLEACLDIRYVIAVRTLNFVPPKLLGDGSFSGGDVEVLFFLYDRQSKMWLGSGLASASAPEELEYRSRKYQEESWALGAINVHCSRQIGKQISDFLTQKTGGFFEFNHKEPKADGTSAYD